MKSMCFGLISTFSDKIYLFQVGRHYVSLGKMKIKTWSIRWSLCYIRKWYEQINSYMRLRGFPGGPVAQNHPANAGDTGSVAGSGRSPGEGNVNPPQCSCLENSMDRGAWWATALGVPKSQTRLSNWALMHDAIGKVLGKKKKPRKRLQMVQ